MDVEKVEPLPTLDSLCDMSYQNGFAQAQVEIGKILSDLNFDGVIYFKVQGLLEEKYQELKNKQN